MISDSEIGFKVFLKLKKFYIFNKIIKNRFKIFSDLNISVLFKPKIAAKFNKTERHILYKRVLFKPKIAVKI